MLDLWAIKKELTFVKREDGYVKIGPMITIEELYHSFLGKEKKYQGFSDLYKYFGTPYLKNIATIGGNIGTGHPLSDAAILLLALDAEVKLTSINGERWVKLKDLYVDLRKLARRPEELITEIRFRDIPNNSSTALLKLDRRQGHAMGYIVVAAYMALDKDRIANVRVAFDSMGKPYPGRAFKTEEFLKGKTLDEETIVEAYKVLESEMQRISDYRAPAEYRLYLSKILMKKALFLIKDRVMSGG